MANAHDLSCGCGATRWTIAAGARGALVKCYCADCQSFARHLGKGDDWLDSDGGTAIFQTLPQHVSFPSGTEHVAALRLGPKGLMRWYAACCNSPIANTLPGPGFPIFSAILKPAPQGFGPVIARVNTAAARKPVRGHGTLRAILGALRRAAVARLGGGYRRNPLFDSAGTPIAEPRILSRDEREAARPH